MGSLLKAVLLSLIMAMSLQKAMSLKKAGGMSLLKAFLLMGIFFLGPVEGHPNFPWWNVRFFDGTVYLINHVSQWQEELSMWQVLSLEEAFQQDPEMQIYIMGHSQMGSPSTNYAPIWNSRASQWLLATKPPGPNQQAGQMLDLELLHYRVEEKQRREQNRVINRWSKGEEAKKGCGKSWEHDPVYWWAQKKKSQIMAGGKKIGIPPTTPADLQGQAGSLMRLGHQAHQNLHPVLLSGVMRDILQGDGGVPVEGIREINTSKGGSQSQNTCSQGQPQARWPSITRDR